MIAELSGGKLTLWQFLLELLMNDEYTSLIKWTDRNIGEFILIQAEEVAKLWGIRKDRNHRMNYDKLSRALRYYYQKNIIKKVHGHKFVYRFVSVVPDSIDGYCSGQKVIMSNGKDSVTNTTETSSSDNGNCRNTSNPQSPLTQNMLRTNNRNIKNHDFHSTLTAFFQAALLSLSGSNPDISSRTFSSNKESQPLENTKYNNNKPTPNLASDTVNHPNDSHSQECDYKLLLPTSPGIGFPSSSSCGSTIQTPSFDRQSIMHFNRHSINMQRLSQEIFLHSTFKPIFNPCIINPFSSSTAENSVEQSNHKFWLDQLSKNLHKPTSSVVNSPKTNNTSTEESQSSPNDKDPTEPIIKTEQSLISDHQTNLSTSFERFVKEFEIKTSVPSMSSNCASSQQYHNYFNTDIANLIKSQLSSQSSFVWMPVPVNFAEEIMEFCLKTSSDHSPS